ncbi:MAG: hypothetical protein ABI831_01430 [Betaproteobacteria bacterium]
MKPVIRPIAMVLPGLMLVAAAIAQTPFTDNAGDTPQSRSVDKASAMKQARTADKARTAKPVRSVDKARAMTQTQTVDRPGATTQMPTLEARASAVRATAATTTATTTTTPTTTTPATTALAAAGTTSSSAIKNATRGAKDRARLPELGAPEPPVRFGNAETAATAPDSQSNPRDSGVTRPDRNPLRFRLDDGRYLGFHQNGGDQSASGTGLPPENERVQRLPAKEARPAPR